MGCACTRGPGSHAAWHGSRACYPSRSTGTQPGIGMTSRTTSPRSLLALAGAIAIACAACAQPSSPAGAQAVPADADTAPVQSPDVHRFTIGALQAVVLRDGDITLPNDGSIVAMGEPKAEVDALLEAAGESTDPLRLAIQALLVEAGERVVLFDTGAGAAEWAD